LAIAPMLAAFPAPLPSLWGWHLGGLHPHNHTQARHSLLDRAHSALIDAVGRTLALCDGPTGQFSSVAGVLVAAEAVATREQEVILTTLKMDASNLQLVMMRQWMGSLRSRAANVLVVGTDNATCHVLRARKIPCFVDRVAQEHELARDRKIVRGSVNMFGAQVMLKWWYTRALIQNGFHVLFADADVAWLQDPIEHWDRSFDLQGLSDMHSVNLTLQPYHELTCMRGWMEAQYSHSKMSVYPCQSAGLFYLRSSEVTRSFTHDLFEYVRENSKEWDQKAYQLMVMRYLIGLGDELPPMRYRLLPPSRFVNIIFYEERARQRLDVSGTVATHCGYLNTDADKLEHLELNGFLRQGLQSHQRLEGALARGRHDNTTGTGAGLRRGGEARLERNQLLSLRRKNRTIYRVFV